MKSKFLVAVILVIFSAPVFAQTADMSLIPYRKGDLWGYATTEGIVAIKAEYTKADLFHEGLAAVQKGGKYGYINKEGKVVIPIKFYVAKPFRFGYFPKGGKILTADDLDEQQLVLFAGASLRTDGYEICINTKGEAMTKCPAIPENSAPEVNKPSTVTYERNYSTIQKSELFDKIIADYKLIEGSDETYYIAIRSNKYGVFNNKFEVILPFEYTKISNIMIGAMNYLIADKEGMKGVFFGNGSPYVTVENSRLDFIETPDARKYFIIAKDGKTGVKDMRHNYVVPMNYTDVTYDSTGHGFILSNNPLKGYYFLNNRIEEPVYKEVKGLPDGAFIMVKNDADKWGYINSNAVKFFEDDEK